MATATCPGCLERDAEIADLKRRVAALEALVRDLTARLNTNATNSGTPPSANPIGAPKPVIKKKSRRRPGGQPGHPPHLKQLLPPARVNVTHPLLPQQCEHCHTALPAEAAPGDPGPTRFQVIELPPVVAHVTEYQGHARTCPCCGHVTRAAIPRDILAHSVGPRLAATLSYFSGCHGVSKRGVEEISAAVFDAPVALGTVANLEQEVSAALAAPHQEAVQAVRAAAVKHADETSWKLAGRLCWLWAAAAAGVVAFVIHARRSAAGLAALLGAEIQGILCSDRWGVYNCVPAGRRQVCWAHLKRDFQKVIDRGGPSQHVGRQGLKIVKKVFAAWHAFQGGRCTRAQLEAQLDPVAVRLSRVLLEGAILGEDKAVATFCENVLALEAALWTFVTTAGVEPTNNFMERLLRRAVLWRKRSFGSRSQAGLRFVERILTVVQTRRLQGQSVLDYLHDALRAHRAGQPCPKLVPTG
jgi:transposase